MYENGLFIRDRYNDFFNSYLTNKVSYARATDSDRAINSVQLIAAGIWPPNETQKWGPINWQPVPVRCDPLNEDNVGIYIFKSNFNQNNDYILVTSCSKTLRTISYRIRESYVTRGGQK